MAVIFNKEGLKDLMPPCVVQQFVNHNAVLFKVMILLDFKPYGLINITLSGTSFI